MSYKYTWLITMPPSPLSAAIPKTWSTVAIQSNSLPGAAYTAQVEAAGGTVTVLMNPPPEIPDPLPQPPAPPPINLPDGPVEPAEGDGEWEYEFEFPEDTEETEVTIEIPTESDSLGRVVKIISYPFQFTPINITGTVGESCVFVLTDTHVHKIDGAGNTLWSKGLTELGEEAGNNLAYLSGDEVYLSTRAGIYRVSKSAVTKVLSVSEPDSITNIRVNASGNFWVCGQKYENTALALVSPMQSTSVLSPLQISGAEAWSNFYSKGRLPIDGIPIVAGWGNGFISFVRNADSTDSHFGEQVEADGLDAGTGVDKFGNVFFARTDQVDPTETVIQKYSPSGVLLYTKTIALETIYITVSQYGDVYAITASGSLIAINPDGTTAWTQPYSLACVSVAADRKVFIGDD